MMSCRFVRLTLCAFFAFPPLFPKEAVAAPQTQEFTAKIQQAKDKVFPALVYIRVVVSDYSGGKEIKYQAGGSGTIISPDGLVLTNFHVAGDGVRFLCALSDREEVPATLIGGDYLNDLALIQLDLSKRKNNAPLAVAALGSSKRLAVGDPVLAMGAPLGLSRSVTMGIVSNTERFLGEMPYERGRQVGLYTTWIQHDALILPGNSGGPLVNLNGEVVGVNTLGGAGMGLAVPSDIAKEIVSSLKALKTVPRNFLGVNLQKTLKGPPEKGTLVSYVFPGAPAARAGLQAGDVLLSVNGQPTNVQFDEELPRAMKMLAELPLDRDSRWVVARGASRLTLAVRGQLKEDDAGRERECKALGITVRDLTTPVVLRRRLQDKAGVIVTGVKDLSPAALAKPALQYDDIVRRFDGQPVTSYDTFIQLYEAAVSQEKKTVLVEFERDFGQWVTLVRPLSKKELERESKGVSIRRGWLGCDLQLFTDRIGKKLFNQDVAGLRVIRVFEDGPAAQAGWRVGDVVTHQDGEPLSAKRDEDVPTFEEMLKAQPAGATLTFTVFRGGQVIQTAVTVGLEPLGSEDVDTYKHQEFGFTARDLVFDDRVTRNLRPDEQGVVLKDVERGGWAQFAGLEAGDLVLQVDGRPTRSVAEFSQAINQAAERKNKDVTVYVLRGGVGRFVGIETEWDKIK